MKSLLTLVVMAAVAASGTGYLASGSKKSVPREVDQAARSATEQPRQYLQFDGPQPTLAEQLKVLLKPRLPEQVEFIEMVVRKVEDKTLPRDLVESTMLWAQKKKPHPYPYFERGLRERAAMAGIEL